MDIEVRRLTPDLVDDYVGFFDTTPHADKKPEHRCYCVWWCSDDSEGKDFVSSLEARRNQAIAYVKSDSIRGYLACRDGKVVGWCNANTKRECLKCYCWRRFMGFVPTEESSPDTKVKSVFCFVIAPEMRRQGITTLLLERVCRNAARDGFDVVEAYPMKTFVSEAEDCAGPAEVYRRNGFSVHLATDRQLVVRKRLR